MMDNRPLKVKQSTRLQERIVMMVARFFAPTAERVWKRRNEVMAERLADAATLLKQAQDVLTLEKRSTVFNERQIAALRKKHSARIVKDIDKLLAKILRDFSRENAVADYLNDDVEQVTP